MAWIPSPRLQSLNSVPCSVSPKASLQKLSQAFRARIAHLPLARRLHSKHCLPQAAFCSRLPGLIWMLARGLWVNIATDVLLQSTLWPPQLNLSPLLPAPDCGTATLRPCSAQYHLLENPHCSNLYHHPQVFSQTLGLTFCALCSSSFRNSDPFSRISTEELRRRDTLSCSVDWVSSTPRASWHPVSGSSLLPLDGISVFQCPTAG